MLRFAANLTSLFTELPMLQRVTAARQAGFDGIEVLFPYDLAVKDLVRACRINDLTFVLMNAPPPNWTGGPRGFAADPALSDRFRRDFDRSIRFAAELGVRHVHIMAGVAEGPAAHAAFVENLTWAAARAPDTSLTIEPQNTQDMPGYFLSDFDQAAAILAEVGTPNLGLQMDIYHAHRITGDVLACWKRHRGQIRHVQIAGYPQRHEPDGGEIDLPGFLAALSADGYAGWIGAEYTPATTTEAGLGWLGHG
ncbi:TIM barrel protein [Paracoccus sp. M683]|uniref:hydroxypyruvate isomerase family protein n=1 Tax=Paracoccus sp. M683 TaxID=2594268 RepID=UPI0011801862|nr:TIM barrel protein [Paracoccus sp. M683]TRW95688.1 TIM barrel protein [Paracoccus sp. M683]